MKRLTVSIVLLVLLSSVSIAQMPKELEKSEAVAQAIKDFFRGKEVDGVMIYVSQGKYTEQPPTAEQIKDQYDNSKLVLYKQVFPSQYTVIVSAGSRFEQGPEHYHTFFLKWKEKDKWQVVAWHTSHS